MRAAPVFVQTEVEGARRRESAVVLFGVVLMAALSSGFDTAPAQSVAPSRPAPAGPAWAPRGIKETAGSLDTAIAKLRTQSRDAGLPAAQHVDEYRIDAVGMRIDAEARVRGADYFVVATIGDRSLRFGRANGERWRATTGGTVHLIRADVQGDYLDRWPVAALGFDVRDCSLAGEASLPKPAWVILDRPPLETPHWLYIDEQSGTIVREVWREGGRVETFDFSDERGDPGSSRAYRWHITGPGGAAEVTLLTTLAKTVGPEEVAVPAQGAPEFTEPPTGRPLSASLTSYHRVNVNVRLNGKSHTFVLDSGTPELLLSDGMARANGPVVLGHGTARSIDVDDQVAEDAPFQDVDFYADGLLGFDFFRGRIVHIDYGNDRVEVLPRAGFSPPSGAFSMATDWSEGMPIVSATVAGVTGNRFVLDTGSQRLVLRRTFLQRDAELSKLERSYAPPTTIDYLEGPFSVVPGTARDFIFGHVKITSVPVDAELPDANNMDFPLDGIIGTDELAPFEWWFDADGTTTWFRPY